MAGLFITFEGNEGSGKSTQLRLLASHLRARGREPLVLREPGGTPIGEEIRHTLKHSAAGHAMTPEAELLLMNASRAQLVREVIRPALAAGAIVMCDRFYDSTTAYQGYGRQLELAKVEATIDFAVGDTRPDLTLLLLVSHELSEQRRRERELALGTASDRFERAEREFFERVEQGYRAIAQAEPHRVRLIGAGASASEVATEIWVAVEPLLNR
jgi:dTMP kinase